MIHNKDSKKKRKFQSVQIVNQFKRILKNHKKVVH